MILGLLLALLCQLCSLGSVVSYVEDKEGENANRYRVLSTLFGLGAVLAAFFAGRAG